MPDEAIVATSSQLDHKLPGAEVIAGLPSLSWPHARDRVDGKYLAVLLTIHLVLQVWEVEIVFNNKQGEKPFVSVFLTRFPPSRGTKNVLVYYHFGNQRPT